MGQLPTSNRMGCMAPRKEKVQEDQHCTDSNGGVGHIEGPEVPAAPVHVHEVNHEALPNPVCQVAYRTAENEREPDPGEALVFSNLTSVERDTNQGHDGQGRGHETAKRVGDVVQQLSLI